MIVNELFYRDVRLALASRHFEQVSLASLPDHMRERLDALRRWQPANSDADATATVESLEKASGRTVAHEVREAIDELFGSADWLSGRYYRGATLRA